MRRFHLAGLVVVLVACASALAAKNHPSKHTEREQIEQIEAQWQQAQLNDDAASMEKLLADDYLGITASGELFTKLQQLDHMRNRAFMVTKLDVTDTKIKLEGRVAIVTSKTEIEGTLDGKPITGSFFATRIYRRQLNGNTWKLTSSEATRIPKPKSVSAQAGRIKGLVTGAE